MRAPRPLQRDDEVAACVPAQELNGVVRLTEPDRHPVGERPLERLATRAVKTDRTHRRLERNTTRLVETREICHGRSLAGVETRVCAIRCLVRVGFQVAPMAGATWEDLASLTPRNLLRGQGPGSAAIRGNVPACGRCQVALAASATWICRRWTPLALWDESYRALNLVRGSSGSAWRGLPRRHSRRTRSLRAPEPAPRSPRRAPRRLARGPRVGVGRRGGCPGRRR